MIELLRLILHIMASFFKPRAKLVAEILILRQQLNVLRRQVSKRPQLSNTDRLLFVWLYRWFPSVLGAIAILRPETIIRWHRGGFRSYWRERSRKPVGRPRISAELRNLICAMSRANHLWGAPHIHGELLKLGFTIAQSTVARYMYRDWPTSQGWRTFLTNHVDGIAAIDLFVLPTITFRLLYCLVKPEPSRSQWVDRTAPDVDNEPRVGDLDIPRRAAAVASAQNATSEDLFVKSSRSFDVGDGEKECDGKPVLRRHLIAFLPDLYLVHRRLQFRYGPHSSEYDTAAVFAAVPFVSLWHICMDRPCVASRK